MKNLLQMMILKVNLTYENMIENFKKKYLIQFKTYQMVTLKD